MLEYKYIINLCQIIFFYKIVEIIYYLMHICIQKFLNLV